MNKKITILGFVLVLMAVVVSAGSVIVKNGQINATDSMIVNESLLYVDSGGGGVGIGTTSPDNLLHLYSEDAGRTLMTIEQAVGVGSGVIHLKGTRTAASEDIGRILSYWDGNNVAEIRFDTGSNTTNKDDGAIGFFTSENGSSPQERVTIRNDGNVGIGTASPVTPLSINGGTSDTVGNGILQIGAGTYNFQFRITGSNERSLVLDRYYNNWKTTPIMTWRRDSGNVGIGTIDPNEKLEVAGNINATGDICDGSGNCLNTVSGSGGGWQDDGTDVRLATLTDNVGIGTASPTYNLEVNNANGGIIALTRINTGLSFTDGYNLGALFLGGEDSDSGYGGDAVRIYGYTNGVWNATSHPSSFRVRTTPSDSITAIDRLTIDKDGNVGIGTTDPSYRLVVNDSSLSGVRIQTRTDASDQYAIFHARNDKDNGATFGVLSSNYGGTTFGGVTGNNQTILESNAGSSFYIGTSISAPIILAISRNEKMRVDSNGNVGIGTTTPGEKLQVSGNINATGNICDGSGNCLNTVNASGGGWQDDGTDVRLSTLTDNVGIGTATPASELEVEGKVTIDSTNGYIDFQRSGTTISTIGADSTGDFIVYDTNNSQYALVVKDGGNVGIGTTNPESKLHIYGASGNQLIIDSTSNTAGSIVHKNAGSSIWETGRASNNDYVFYNYDAASQVMVIEDSTGNVGIGTTDPETLLELKQSSDDYTGGLSIRSTGSERAFIYRQNDSDDALIIRNNGYDTLAVENNMVGIGTTSPSQRLDVQGHMSLSGRIIGRGSSYLDISTNTSDGADNKITRIGGGGDVLDYRGGFIELHGNEAPQTGDILLHPGAVNGNIILYTGNVGIGTTSPNNLLELAATHPRLYINGTGNSRLALDRGSVTEKSQVEFKTNGADNWYVGLADSGDLGDGTEFFIGTVSGGDGTPAIVVETTGNVGIGITSPAELLEVSSNTGTATTNPTVIRISTTASASDWNTTTEWGLLEFYSYDGSGGGPKVHSSIGTRAAISSGGSSVLVFNMADTADAMVIDNSGDVGIGITNPGGRRLNVVDGSAGFIVDIENVDTGINADGLIIEIGPTSNPTTSNDFIAFRDGDGDTIDAIEGDGAGGTRYTGDAAGTYSDRRMKKNIQEYDDNAIEFVKQFQPVTFNYINGSNAELKRVGFIAQEVLDIFPQAVNFGDDLSNYTEDELPRLRLSYSQFVPVLTKAIQQQQKQIEDQKEQIDQLKQIVCLDHPRAEVCK